MCLDEVSLAERFAAGGEKELEEVIAAYGEKLLRYAVTILASFHDAEDIIQDVFIAAFDKRKSFDGNNLTGWLYRITYNHCINHTKKRKLVLFAETPEQSVSTDIDTDFSENTLRALRRLKPNERALVHGRVMDERSYEDLAQEFGVSSAVLRKRFERTRKKLAGHLTQNASPKNKRKGFFYENL